MSPSSVIERRFLWACAAAVALFALAYANSFQNGFHFDDDHVIERNLYLRDLRNLPRFFTDASTFSAFPQNQTYRPLVSATLAIDYAVGRGLSPWAFHLSQWLMFLGVGVLLALLAHDVLRRAAGREEPWHKWAALFAGAFFCLHTANTQPGNYLSARSELLSALGVLGAFLLYLRSPRARRSYLYLLPMALGALAKPPAVVFAPLLLVWKVLFEHPQDRLWRRSLRALVETLPAFIAAAALFWFVERMNPPQQTYGGGDRAQYLWTQAWVWIRYARLFVWPSGLSADSDLSLLPTWNDGRVFLGAAWLLGTVAFALWAMRRPALRPVTFGIAWFWAGILPTSLVPLAEVTNDHRMFLGYLGATMALVAGAGAWLSSAKVKVKPAMLRVASVAAVVVLCAHAVGTHLRNRVWRDEESLWADVVQKSPGNGRGWMNYGLTQMRKGELRRAKELFTHALTLTPNYAVLEVNLGIVNNALGEVAEAEAHYQRALRLGPNYAAAHGYYARYLAQRGRAPQALVELQRAIQLEPADPNTRHLLMDLYAAKGASGDLQRTAQETLALGPDWDASAHAAGRPPFSAKADDANAWFDAGYAFTQQEQHARAAQAYRAALAREPSNVGAWNNLGWSLYALGFLDESEAAYQRALALDPANQRARNNLAEVQANRTARADGF